jgi:hypothetical protein
MAGGSQRQIVCGGLGFAAGQAIALATPICQNPNYAPYVKGNTAQTAIKKGYGDSKSQCWALMFADKPYAITTDTALGIGGSVLAMWYCGSHWKEILGGVAGGTVGSIGWQYALHTNPAIP